MSQLAHPAINTRVRSTRNAILAALLALAAVVAVAVVIGLGYDNSSNDQVAVAEQAQPSLRADSGPEESAVAASVGTFATAQPDESHIAALVSAGSTQPTGGPDEAVVAVSVSPN